MIAGLALVLAAAVIPSNREMHGLSTQLKELQDIERTNFAVLGSYARLLQDLEDGEPALIRRLAASQLNVIPKGETPLLMASTVNASVSDWVESTVEAEPYRPDPVPDTLLARWTEGSRRLWAIGAGAFLVFVGLLLTPGASRVDGADAATLEADEASLPAEEETAEVDESSD